MAGDLILKTDSHQQALIATLNEHVSLYGLRAKVLARDKDEFPGGFQFHQKKKDYMKGLFAGTKNAYIFHMSWTLNKGTFRMLRCNSSIDNNTQYSVLFWTLNKDNKLLFFRQLGEWYVQDQCIQKTVDQIGGSSVPATCCSAEALFSCHYRDKPSKLPCKDAPPIDEGKASWW